jgi:hypothetical protein
MAFKLGVTGSKPFRMGVVAALVAFGACDTFSARNPGDQTSPPGPRGPLLAPPPVLGGTAIFPPRSIPAGAPAIASDAGAAISPELSVDVVRSGALARNVLYAWTTAEQVAELREDPRLLTRAESSTGSHNELRATLSTLVQSGDPLAQLLSSPPFQNGRYAWSAAWATLRGWPHESSGNELIRIALKPEAWIVTLVAGELDVVDMANQNVPVATVLAMPDRIAAVYFLNAPGAHVSGCGDPFMTECPTGAYRAYYVNNEAMLLEWSLRTPELLSELQRSISLVASLRDQIAAAPLVNPEPCDFARGVFCGWTLGLEWLGAPPGYMRALALGSASYVPNVANMDALQSALQDSLFTPDPFVHSL